MKKITFLLVCFLLLVKLQAQEVPLLASKDGKYALKSPDGKILSDWYSAVYDFEVANIATVRQSTKFGAINRNGKVIIPIEQNSVEIKETVKNYIAHYLTENANNEEVKKYLSQSNTEANVENKEPKNLENNESYADLLEKANGFYESEDYENAIVEYEKILSQSEGNYDVYKNLGAAYYKIENYAKSIEYLEKALQIEQNANEIHFLANAYTQNKEYAKAIETFDKLTSDYPLFAKRGQANAYHSMGEYSKAYQLINEVCKEEPDNYNNFFNLSFYALFVEKPKESIAAAIKSLALKPEETGVYTNLALAYVLTNEFETAKPIYLEWKDRVNPNSSTSELFKVAFEEDIIDLEAAGIKHKDFKKVRNLLK